MSAPPSSFRQTMSAKENARELRMAWKKDPIHIRSHPLFQDFKHHLLCALVAEGDVAHAAMLIERDGADPTFFQEGTLHSACRANQLEAVEYLLRFPAVRAVSANNGSRCLLEAQAREYTEIVAVLKRVPEIVEAGVDMEKYGYGLFESADGPVTPVLPPAPQQPLPTAPPPLPTTFLQRLCRCFRLW